MSKAPTLTERMEAMEGCQQDLADDMEQLRSDMNGQIEGLKKWMSNGYSEHLAGVFVKLRKEERAEEMEERRQQFEMEMEERRVKIEEQKAANAALGKKRDRNQALLVGSIPVLIIIVQFILSKLGG